MAHWKKSFADEPTSDWGAWTTVRFPSQEARDSFLSDVAAARHADWQVEADTEDARGARVRWAPGHFLGLNDLAYTHGGRIAVDVVGRRK